MTRQEYIELRARNHHPLLYEYYCEMRDDKPKTERIQFYEALQYWISYEFKNLNLILSNIIRYYDSKFNVISVIDKKGNVIKVY